MAWGIEKSLHEDQPGGHGDHEHPLDPGNQALGQHAFIMLGTEALFLCHMTMFEHEEHCYQCVMRATLDAKGQKAYSEAYGTERPVTGGAWPRTLFLANTPESLISVAQLQSGRCKQFQADIFHGIPNRGKEFGWPWDDTVKEPHVLVEDVTVTVDRIVFSRHFDFGFERPQKLTYVLFGEGAEAHMTNFQVTEPEFDHVVSLERAPKWLPEPKLEASVNVTFSIDSQPGDGSRVHCTDPLQPGRYSVKYQGQGPARFDVSVSTTWWFSTAIVNNDDPCKGGTGGSQPVSGHGSHEG